MKEKDKRMKTCPFCGRQPYLCSLIWNGRTTVYVDCECGTSGMASGDKDGNSIDEIKQNTIAKWNRRFVSISDHKIDWDEAAGAK